MGNLQTANMLVPLKFDLVDQWDGIDQLNPEIRSLDDYVSWKLVPKFNRLGRSAWLPLETPIVVSTHKQQIEIHALKIKGVGLCDHKGDIIPPTIQPYYRANPHLGITAEGKFIPLASPPAPLGGITIERARREYHITCNLLESGCPVQIPVRLCQYAEPSMIFQAEGHDPFPLAVIVAGMPQNTDLRADLAFEYDATDEFTKRKLDELIRQMGIAPLANRGLSLLSNLIKLHGRTLRKFSEAGFYRYSSSPDNYAFSPQLGEVFLMDLDSSRELSECSNIARPLQIMRDAASALFHLLAYLTKPQFIRYFPESDVIEANPFRSFLQGYYNDVSSEFVYYLSNVLLTYYQQVYRRVFETSKTPDLTPEIGTPDAIESFQEHRIRNYRQSWINREEAYCLIIAALWKLHERSALLSYAPLLLSENRFYQNLSEYSSPEIAAFIKVQLNQFER